MSDLTTRGVAATVVVHRLDVDDNDPTTQTALFERYPGQTRPQPCHIALNLETGHLWADHNPEIGAASSRPESVVHGRTLWWDIPCLTAAAANRLLEELAPLAQQVLDIATIEWDGANRVGRLAGDPTRERPDVQIARLCQADQFDDRDTVEEYPADVWYAHGDVSDRDAAAELGITADTSDQHLTAAVAAVEAEVRASADACGAVVPTGFVDYLCEIRTNLRKRVAEHLAEVGAEVERLEDRLSELRPERDLLVRRLHAYGVMTNAALARAAGLTNPRIGQLLSMDRRFIDRIRAAIDDAEGWVPTEFGGDPHLSLPGLYTTDPGAPATGWEARYVVLLPCGGGEVFVRNVAAPRQVYRTGIIVDNPTVLTLVADVGADNAAFICNPDHWWNDYDPPTPGPAPARDLGDGRIEILDLPHLRSFAPRVDCSVTDDAHGGMGIWFGGQRYPIELRASS